VVGGVCNGIVVAIKSNKKKERRVYEEIVLLYSAFDQKGFWIE
jgi:hypothetical protein